MRGWPAVLALLLAGAAAAQVTSETPVIRAIAFEGNDTTREDVMLRETVIKSGDRADPALIERSRQGIQDLGLFKSVDVRQILADDGVTVVFTVEEKWYLLPIPRLDANSEGEDAYGVSLRWYNVGGYNHTLRGNWTRRDEAKANRGESTSYGGGYSIPFVRDTPYGISFAASHSETPIGDLGGYLESTDSASVSTSRSYAKGPRSQGLSTAASLGWSRHATEGGPGTPEPNGSATSLGLGLAFRDVRYNLYSEEGVSFGISGNGATEGLASDYSYGQVNLNYQRYTLIGAKPHQSLNYGGAIGSYHGGSPQYALNHSAYTLGGASILRAYPADFVVGDFMYRASVEYLRPVFADWLRGLIVLEAGNVVPDLGSLNDRVYVSVGLGLRVRLTFLVNAEVEFGVAWPLEGGGQRFFASKV